MKQRIVKAHGGGNLAHPPWTAEDKFSAMEGWVGNTWNSACDCHAYRSGCDSLESLKEWFGEFWDDLIRAGFAVVTYLTDDYILADKQLVFKP